MIRDLIVELIHSVMHETPVKSFMTAIRSCIPSFPVTTNNIFTFLHYYFSSHNSTHLLRVHGINKVMENDKLGKIIMT